MVTAILPSSTIFGIDFWVLTEILMRTMPKIPTEGLARTVKLNGVLSIAALCLKGPPANQHRYRYIFPQNISVARIIRYSFSSKNVGCFKLDRSIANSLNTRLQVAQIGQAHFAELRGRGVGYFKSGKTLGFGWTSLATMTPPVFRHISCNSTNDWFMMASCLVSRYSIFFKRMPHFL
jgi:hypothetical protein